MKKICCVLMALFLSPLALANWDQDLYRKIRSNKGVLHSPWMTFGEMYGSQVSPAIALFPYAVSSLAASKDENHPTLRAFRITARSYLVSAVSVVAIKGLVGRARPYVGKAPNTFKPFSYTNSDYQSFPSGHTSAAVSMSVAFAESMDSNVLRLILYPAAFVAGLSRIVHEKHWPSDIVAGALVGYAAASWSLWYDSKTEADHSFFYPSVDSQKTSLAWVHIF